MAPREVYLDNSATTKVDPRVTEAMLPYFSEKYGNPNSLHKFGREARAAIDNARAQVASLINAKPTDIIFTGAGSEADNLAIKGAAWALKEKGKGSHIITSAIEHHAILDTVRWLGKMGFEYTILPVDDKGFVSPADLEAAIRPDTILATIMFANNEIGTIQPVKELGEVCRRHGVMFHVDGVQAAGHIKVDVEQLPIDMMTMAAHKMYGPKGLGALYVRRGVKLIPTLHGGGQEFGLRSGTENVPGIVGFGVAAEIASFQGYRSRTSREPQETPDCPSTRALRSNISRERVCCFCSTRRASPPPAVRPVPPAALSPATCCLLPDSTTPRRTVRCVSR